MGLTTFTPTTISCAEARAGARKKIATERTAVSQRRFISCILFSRTIAKVRQTERGDVWTSPLPDFTAEFTRL
jgi:hypothetical protein